MGSSSEVDREVRTTLATIRKQGWPEQYAALQELSESRSPAAERILLRLLDDRSSNVREQTMVALRERDPILGRIAARSLLSDPNDCVRNSAVETLGTCGGRPDIRRLKQALQDTDWVVRASAASSLGTIGGKAAHPVLIKAMREDPDPVVRRDAAAALGYAGEASVLPDLMRAQVEETEEQAQVGLLSALYELGQTAYLPSYLALLKSEDDFVRYATVNSMEDLIRSEDCKTVVQAIREMVIHESNPGLRSDATRIADTLAARGEDTSA